MQHIKKSQESKQQKCQHFDCRLAEQSYNRTCNCAGSLVGWGLTAL